jgi:D-beta-D-heptose 7-phosphate kinase/D-beta-D-heptose 1-phosphate adenosyltransferase
MARHQHVTRIDRENAEDVSDTQAQRLSAILRRLVPSAGAVALEDYNKGVLVPSLIRAALDASRSHGIPSVVDPKRLRFFAYAGATVFKPNARELEDAVGERLKADDPGWMEKTRDRLSCETLLLTLGEDGMAIQSRGTGLVRVPTSARDVYDVSGAGDTVTAVVAVALASDSTPTEAAVLANHAAAVEVGKAGVATVSPEEILSQQAVFADAEEDES